MFKVGFTLIELMIVITIISFLSVLSIPHLMKVVAKAKRSEAYLYLRSIASAERIYFAEHGSYTAALTGKDSLDWKPEGAHAYTYGFPGTQEGVGHFVGTLHATASSLAGGTVSAHGFIAVAAGKIYGDKLDILTIDEKGSITVVQDALN